MVKTIKFALMALFVLVASACTNSSPESVASAFMEDMKQGNFDNISTLIYLEEDVDAATLDMVKGKLATASKFRKIESYEIDSSESEISEDGKTAKVKFKVISRNAFTGESKEDTEFINTELKDGKWYISLGAKMPSMKDVKPLIDMLDK